MRVRHRPRTWVARVGTSLINTGRVLFFVIMGSAVVVGASIGVAGILNAQEPRYWGTFTEESCIDGPRFGCRSVGTWVSDDGTIRLEDVYLDGGPNEDGTVAAQYHPTGIGGDEIVHTAFGVALEPLAPVILIAFAGGAAFVQWRRWRGTWNRRSGMPLLSTGVSEPRVPR